MKKEMSKEMTLRNLIDVINGNADSATTAATASAATATTATASVVATAGTQAMKPAAKNSRRIDWRQIEDEETPIASYEALGLRMSVFPSGYITAHSGRNHTCFRLEDCGGYRYRFVGGIRGDSTRHRFDDEYFLDLKWEIRVLLEAEDRLSRNNDLYEFGRIGKHRTW